MERATDVFVIGGGPAGLAAAIAARQSGLDVVVADGARPPIDKPCGEGLMPDGRAALAQLGISIPEADSHPFRGISFVSGGLRVAASFPKGEGIGVRRTILHRLMVARAEAAGVSLLWQTPVTALHADGVLMGKQLIRSHWIVGADGGHSLVRRWAGLDRYHYDRTRFAFRRHYRVAPWSDCMELHWGPKCQIYVTQSRRMKSASLWFPAIPISVWKPRFPNFRKLLRDSIMLNPRPRSAAQSPQPASCARSTKAGWPSSAMPRVPSIPSPAKVCASPFVKRKYWLSALPPAICHAISNSTEPCCGVPH